MKPPLRVRVAKRLETLNRTVAEAQEIGGLKRTFIRDILRSKDNRSVRGVNAAKLALAIDSDIEYVTGTQSIARRYADGDGSDHDVKIPLQPVRVVGTISAGRWHEISPFGVDVLSQPVEADAYPPVPSVPDSHYQGLEQFAVKVEGPSINRVIPDGDFAICVPYWEYRVTLHDGDLVVVERTRTGLHEATIKRLRRNGRCWELHPESTDKRHQSPIRLVEGEQPDREESSDILVEIKGLVIGRYGAL